MENSSHKLIARCKQKERELQAREEGINQWKGPRFVGRVYSKADYALALFLNHLCRNKNAPLPICYAMFMRIAGT